MSSAVYISFKETIQITDFLIFCEQHGIEFSPNTVCQNCFYKKGVQVVVDGIGVLPQKENGQRDFDNAKPPKEFDCITVSSYHGSNLDGIAELATLMLFQWHGRYECDPELTELMTEANSPPLNQH